MTNTLTDEKAPIFLKMVNDHPLFAELKTLVDAVETARYKRSKRYVGSIWDGFHEDDQYLSFVTKNNKLGNKIAEIQYKILSDTGFLLDANAKPDTFRHLDVQQAFLCFRCYSIDWDKVRLL